MHISGKGLIDGKIIVSLDLEKAFEFANKDAILALLAENCITGRLHFWLKDYQTDRYAKVGFQGYLSTTYKFDNGIPQGGLLSPFLFNVLISQLMEIQFPTDVQLLAYADDLQLVATGPNRHINTP